MEPMVPDELVYNDELVDEDPEGHDEPMDHDELGRAGGAWWFV